MMRCFFPEYFLVATPRGADAEIREWRVVDWADHEAFFDFFGY